MKRLNRLLPLIIVLLFTTVVDAGAQHGQAEVSGGWWLKGMVTDGHGEPLVGRLSVRPGHSKGRYRISTVNFLFRYVKGRSCCLTMWV